MYFFQDCPFQVEYLPGHPTCFDPSFVECFSRPLDIIQSYCRGDFRGCPYYLTQGLATRIPEEAHRKAIHIARRACSSEGELSKS